MRALAEQQSGRGYCAVRGRHVQLLAARVRHVFPSRRRWALDPPPVSIRPAVAGDLEHIQWALYAALDWNPERQLPPLEFVLQHPEAVRYHEGWGRLGDLGVIAERDGAVNGVAYCRLFTDDDHGHGYVDEETPEVAIAVHEECRGTGIGAQLLTALARVARESGFTRLSLSVDGENPARRLYERLGYRTVAADDDGVRMALELR
jgi:ribosomal protein S18 acetylase RimI-like enzyme